jgi:hypothetical protein
MVAPPFSRLQLLGFLALALSAAPTVFHIKYDGSGTSTFFGNGTTAVTAGLASTGFGRVSQTGTSRRIEFRGNHRF